MIMVIIIKDIAKSRSVVSKKQHRPIYISPMSTNKIVNLRKLNRVVAPKPIMSDIVEGNKRGTKRRMVLLDEDDDEDDEIFEGGNILDVAAQDEELEDMNDTIDTYDQNDIQMADREGVQEQLQGPEKEKAAGTFVTEIEQPLVNDALEMEDKGALKKGRGHTQKADIWKMGSNERICVTFDKCGQPVGNECKELVQYLGTIVRMGENVSIGISDWRRVPKQNKEDMYSLVKSKFTFHPAETSQIKKWILYNMGKKWRGWKGSLKCAYDPSLTIDETVAQLTSNDDRVNPTQIKELVTRWFTSDFQTCAKKRKSRSMMEPHVTGTKSFARVAHEMAMKNDGIYPARGEMYIKTRTRKDGRIVDDKAASVVTSLKALASDSTSTPGEQDDFENDAYSKVKGPEKRGYVRLVGRMPPMKSNGDSQIMQQLQSATQTINQLQGAFNVLLNAFQEHIPNANLSTILTNMDIQVPRIGPNNGESSRNTEHEESVDKM